MAKEINEDTTLQLSIKTLAGIAVLIFTLVGMWFTLQADITEAKELPLPPDPEITRMEYDMKDQLIRQTIMTCLLYTSPSPRDKRQSRMPSSA